MAYYFINTDSKSLGKKSPHNKWFKYKKAFTGGEFQYGEKLGKLRPSDTLLMYATGIGVVGAGKVAKWWNKKIYRWGDQIIYKPPFQCAEYRIDVNWDRDFRSNPIHNSNFNFLPKSYPNSTLEEIKDEYIGKVERVLQDYSQTK